MECPFRLVKRGTSANADAALLFATDHAALAAAFVRMETLPAIFRVHGGFLLVSKSGHAIASRPGTIRLRRLAGDLYIPVEAELLPALLPEEMVALTRSHGLAMLPGGDALAFDAANPLPVSQWLAPPRIDRGVWHTFPQRPHLADRLTVIEGPPAPMVMDVLQEGAPPDANPLPGPDQQSSGAPEAVPTEARPPAGSLGQRLTEGVRFGVAGMLAWLGRNLNAPGLAKLGGDLARKAIERVPRLTEKLLGDQEAALREVLRQLQSGEVDKALRRAPIAVADPDARGSIGTNANLGTRDPRYSLRDLISTGGGTATGWLGGGDVWNRLAEEYRRLAQDAARRGDHRRAAYLYGVLLRDPRAAANVLMADGLHRDAAVIFRDRLKDDAAAANAFEQAGDYDEALRLHDKLGEYERAAHLLRKLGDEERALQFFLRAADRYAGQNRFLNAGDLVRMQAGRSDLAAAYYRRGWQSHTPEVVTCGERLLDEYLVREFWLDAIDLLDEAEVNFAPPRTTEAGRFFNYALSVRDDFLPATLREALPDRVRLFFAEHLRHRVASGGGALDMASELFGRVNAWPAPVARDANYASRKPPQRALVAKPASSASFQIAEGAVRAVAVARNTSDLIIATTEEIVCWRSNSGRVEPIFVTENREILGLATDGVGNAVYMLFGEEGKVHLLRYVVEDSNRFTPTGGVELDTAGCNLDDWHLQSQVWDHPSRSAITVSSTVKRMNYVGPFLREETLGPFVPNGPSTHLLVVTDKNHAWDWDDRFMRLQERRNALVEFLTACRWTPTWKPGIVAGSTLAYAQVDWMAPTSRTLEVVGVDANGIVYWSQFDREAASPQSLTLSRTVSTSNPGGYTAACLCSPGKLAAITTQNEVHWFRVAGSVLLPMATQVSLAMPVRAAALASRLNELIVIFEDGSAIRLPRT